MQLDVVQLLAQYARLLQLLSALHVVLYELHEPDFALDRHVVQVVPLLPELLPPPQLPL